MDLKLLQGIMKNEGDRFQFSHLHLTCIGIRNEIFGHWCGYVVIPSNFGNIVDQNKISVHGGVTYNGTSDSIDTGDILIGFDANHHDDINEYMFSVFGGSNIMEGSSYKDINFIKNECISMVEQIHELYPEYKRAIDRDEIIDKL